MEADIVERLPSAAVVRTSLVCWDDPPDPRTAWVLDGLLAGEPPTLFTDELRNPVRVDDLAAALWTLVAIDPPDRSGVWHIVGAEALSRYELGVLIARWAGLDPAAIVAAESRAARARTPTAGLPPHPARADAAGISRSVRTLFAR